MISTFGQFPASPPKGFSRAINFPILALLDAKTGDGRMLDGQGGKTRALPLSIRTVMRTGMGHDNAVVSGALFEVTFNPDEGKVSGRGYLLDDEAGDKSALYVASGAMSGNSLDLAEIKARFEEDLETGEYWIRFTEWAIAATTLVGTPAFAEAHAEVAWDDEMTAALANVPLEITASFTEPPDFRIIHDDTKLHQELDELVASGAVILPFDHFTVPEASAPQKVIVTEDRRVYGHLGLWESCHDGFEGQCVRIPRPADGYASFNKPGPLTDRGQVATGPIFAFGGHRKSNSAPTIEQAYGGIENTWADVRITEGKFGPWLSGVVRPGVPEDVVHAARCSRISGHWVGGRLKAIVSVNAEGFDVPGATDAERDLVAGFAFAYDGEVSELVASFPPCLTPPDDDPLQPDPIVPVKMTAVLPEGADPVQFTSDLIADLAVHFERAGVLPTGDRKFELALTDLNGTPIPKPPEPTRPDPFVVEGGARKMMLALLAEDDD